ncbi:hypothetical protein [Natronomonas amylolytica]|uniref:hypothetical protein n=1 Tax=Natronomonas amylolytica TaxID=3108498 RepID=UPI003009CE30
MSDIGDFIPRLRAVGAISAFVLLFTAFGIFSSNPTLGSAETLIIVITVVAVIIGLSARVWNSLFKGF